MAVFRNNSTMLAIREALGLQLGTDKLPVPIPVVEVNPRLVQGPTVFLDTTATNTTATGAAAGSDLMLQGFILTVIKDATSTSTKTYATAYIDGKLCVLGAIAGITLTAQQAQIVVQYPRPIRIDDGTNIAVNNTTNVANITATIQAWGYRQPRT